MRIGINGFGRIGRLVFRALWGRPGIELVHINDPAGDAATAAHLLEFDSVHGRWCRGITSSANGFSVEGSELTWSSEKDPTAGCNVAGRGRWPSEKSGALDRRAR